MIKVIDEDHPMAEYASTWCEMRWSDDAPLVEFLELLEQIGTVDGNDWVEVDLIRLEEAKKDGRSRKRLLNPPRKADFYWGWSRNQAGYRKRFDVFFTTELQATYYAMAATENFPVELSDDQKADNILNAIRARSRGGNSAGSGNGGTASGGTTFVKTPQEIRDLFNASRKKAPDINPEAKSILDRNWIRDIASDLDL